MGAPKYRHEIKHFINLSDYFALRQRMRVITRPDPYAGTDGQYKVRSLYFDNLDNKALMEKINGVNHREKFRIRFYNDNPSFIKLEKKGKVSGLCTKQSTAVTREQCERMIRGDISWMADCDNALLLELYAKMRFQLLKPKTVVDYTREAYIYTAGNVRITFDSNIRSGLYSQDIFNPELSTMSVTENKQIILEVKFDGFLPEMIQDMLQTNTRQSTAVSKYAVCRTLG